MKPAGLPLLLLTLLLLLPAGRTAAQAPAGPPRLYRSNGLGMALEAIPPQKRGETEYVLEERPAPGGGVRRLLRKGEEVRRWEDTRDAGGRLSETRLFEKGVLSEVQRFDGEGRLAEEEQYRDGTLSSRTVYRYAGRVLREVEASDASGNLLWRERYRLAENGDLRSVRREGPEGDGRGFSLLRAQGRLLEERQQQPEELILIRYDARGHLRQREVWQKDTLVSVLEYRYTGERLEAVTETDPRTGTRTDRRFDEEGRLLQEEAQREGKTASDTRSEYDAAGRKSRTTRRGEQGLEEWRYEYAADGALQQEEYRVKGAVQKITRYGPGEARSEELYREGQPFLRVTYEGEEKIREEVLEGGRVLRVREYRGKQGP